MLAVVEADPDQSNRITERANSQEEALYLHEGP
jgi:hypothetical protein